jgi:nitroreductase
MKKVKEILKIPEEYKVIALLTIGYPYEKFDIQGNFLHVIRKRKKIRKK